MDIHILINDKLYKYSDSHLKRITRLRGSQWWIAWALSSSLWSLQMRYSWRWCAGPTSRWEIPAWNLSVHFFRSRKLIYLPVPPNKKRINFLFFSRIVSELQNGGIELLRVRDGICARKNRRGRQWEAHLKQGESLRCQTKSEKATPALQCMQWNQAWCESFHEDGHFWILWLLAPYWLN